MKKEKITVLFDTPGPPPANQDYTEELRDTKDTEAEYEVARALARSGYEVTLLGFYDKIRTIIECLQRQQPEIVFNMTEHFKGQSWLDRSIADILEIVNVPYTGSSATALLLARDKAITKEILTAHHIKTPRFSAFLRGRYTRYSKKLKFPLIVKPLSEDASIGIAQASIIDNEKALLERISMVHESFKCDAIVEEFIPGRELYVSILGNKRLRVLPIREMKFGKAPDEENRIATYMAKWDDEYRKRWSIQNVFARDISPEISTKIQKICKRAYRALRLRDYGRIDIRMTPQNEIYIIEANPNPYLARGEEFPESAKKAGISYSKLIDRIVQLALKRYRKR